MEKRKDYKSLVIVGLLFAIVAMSVGYAALSQTLVVNGTATIDASWDVKIVSIEETAKSISPTEVPATTELGEDATDAVTEGAKTSSAAIGSTTAAFNVTLNAPGDYAEFTVTVKNLGTIAAKLKTLTLVEGATDPEQIVYTVTPANATGAATLAADGTETYVVRVEWTAETDIPTVKTKTATLTLDYVQDTN